MKTVWISLTVLVCVGLIYIVAMPRSSDIDGGSSDYEELAACAFLTSIDSRKSLYLSRSHVARLSANGGTGTEWATGTWRLVDDEKLLFEVAIGADRTLYTLVSAPEGEGCMLVPGDTSRADLARAWYSTLQDPK